MAKKKAAADVMPQQPHANAIRHRIILNDDYSFVSNFEVRIEAGILMLLSTRETGETVIERAFSPHGWREIVRES